MFVVVLKYIASLDRIEQLIPGHREFLKKYYANFKFLVSGPQEPREGGIIIMNADSKDEVYQILEEDPFWQEKAADYTVYEFSPMWYDKRLSVLFGE